MWLDKPVSFQWLGWNHTIQVCSLIQAKFDSSLQSATFPLPKKIMDHLAKYAPSLHPQICLLLFRSSCFSIPDFLISKSLVCLDAITQQSCLRQKRKIVSSCSVFTQGNSIYLAKGERKLQSIYFWKQRYVVKKKENKPREYVWT